MSKPKGKSNGKANATENTEDQSSEADGNEAVRGSEATETAEAEGQVLATCRCASLRLGDKVFPAFITRWVTPNVVNLAFCQGKYWDSRDGVRKGLDDGQWWLSEAELRTAIALERVTTK
jgi:hypothetical protein